MKSRSQVMAALTLLSTLLLGCPIFSAPADGGDGIGGVKELVSAEPQRVRAPRYVMADEPLILTVRGRHADSCTRFERFETRPWAAGDDVEMEAWAAGPVGGCPGEGERWDSLVTISGLPQGERGLRIGGRERARTTVLLADPGSCGEPEPIAIRDVLLPPAPHALGSARLQVEIRHPTPCHGPPVVRHEIEGSEIHLFAEARSCVPPTGTSACSEWNLTKEVSVDVGPLVPGSWRVIFDEGEYAMSVMETSSCSMQRMLVDSAFSPRMVTDDEPLGISIRGRLPSSCAAVNATRWSVDGDILLVDVEVRDCEHACVDWEERVDVEIETALTGLPIGKWNLRVGDVEIDRPVYVAPADLCSYQPLPEDSIQAVLATSGLYSDLSAQSAAAREPLDVHALGELPDGCWHEPRLEALPSGSGESGKIDLRSRALWCDLACDETADGEPRIDPQSWLENGAGDPQEGDDGEDDPIITGFDGPRSYSAGWSRPAGLAGGSYDLFVDGRKWGTVVVE